jgi:hypothetical protein
MSARPDRLFRYPACGHKTRQPRAIQVSHECPARMHQPAPAKGKRKLPLWVDYERIDTPESPAHTPNGPKRPSLNSPNRPSGQDRR